MSICGRCAITLLWILVHKYFALIISDVNCSWNNSRSDFPKSPSDVKTLRGHIYGLMLTGMLRK